MPGDITTSGRRGESLALCVSSGQSAEIRTIAFSNARDEK
jgi:hypothetical protein